MDFLVYITALWQDMISGVGAIVLIVLSLIALFATTLTMKKKVFKVSILTVVGFYVFVKCTCGPNFFDVRIMYPMAEKISQYIEKHGIPKSLKDIPDLPYGLEGCERSEEYLKGDNNGGMEKTSKGKAILYNVREKCHFKNIELSYWLQKDSDVSISITLSSKNRTYVDYGGGAENDKKIIFDIKTLGSSKTSGICNPMRQ